VGAFRPATAAPGPRKHPSVWIRTAPPAWLPPAVRLPDHLTPRDA